ncbi:hypothetical protein D9M71_542620 [compost metagenome]
MARPSPRRDARPSAPGGLRLSRPVQHRATRPAADPARSRAPPGRCLRAAWARRPPGAAQRALLRSRRRPGSRVERPLAGHRRGALGQATAGAGRTGRNRADPRPRRARPLGRRLARAAAFGTRLPPGLPQPVQRHPGPHAVPPTTAPPPALPGQPDGHRHRPGGRGDPLRRAGAGQGPVPLGPRGQRRRPVELLGPRRQRLGRHLLRCGEHSPRGHGSAHQLPRRRPEQTLVDRLRAQFHHAGATRAARAEDPLAVQEPQLPRRWGCQRTAHRRPPRQRGNLPARPA